MEQYIDILNANFPNTNMPNVVVGIMVVILGVFIYQILKLKFLSDPITKDLREALGFIEQFNENINYDEFSRIDEKFKKLPYIANQWQEFTETLIKNQSNDQKGVICNTAQVQEFINSESIICSNLQVRKFNSIPGILTGLGLLGTFISILIGLAHVHVNGLKVDGIEGLINGLSGKFWSSIFGLSFSLIFTVVENNLIGRLESKCLKIQNKLNSIFSRNIPEFTAISMNNYLKVISEKLSIGDNLDKFASVLSELSDNFKETAELKNLLKEEFTQLRTQMDFITRQLSENSNRELIDQFKGYRADVKDDNNKTRELLTSINSSVVDNITEQFKNLRTEIRDSDTQIIHILNDNFKETNRCLNEAVETLSKGATEEIIKALEQVIRDFNNNLTEQFGENFKELNNAVIRLVDWQENYKSAIEQIERNLQLTIESMNNTDQTLANIASKNL